MLFRKILLLLICSLLATASFSKNNPVFHDTEGHNISVSKMQNEWIIIVYWASWCSTCKKEIPTLNDFYQHHHYKNFALYGVNYDQLPPPELKQAISSLHIAFPTLEEDPRAVWQLGEVTAVPTIFVINPAGKVVNKFVGSVSEQTLLDAVKG